MKGCSTFVAVLLFVTAQSLVANSCGAQAESKTQAAAQPQQGTQPEPSSNTSAATNATVSVTSLSNSTARTRDLSPGTTLIAEFSGTLNAKKLKPGDKVKAVLTQDLIAGGRLVAKSETKLVGHVVEVQARSDENPESRLSVVFDKMRLKKHHELNFQAVVQALAPPAQRRSLVDEPDPMMPPATGSIGGMSRGQGRRGMSSGRTSSSATTLSDFPTSLGQVAVVGSNPGNLPGNSRGTASRPASGGATPISGGTGVRGVYGLKDLTLQAEKSGANSATAIVSKKSNVKLDNGTQVILLVVN